MHAFNQRGSALFISLILLVGITLIGLSSMSSSIMQEKMANNFRQEDLAFQSAASAMRWAEFWLLGQKTRPEPSDCMVASAGSTGGTATAGGCSPDVDAVLAKDSFAETPPEKMSESWWMNHAREFGKLYENWGTASAGTQWKLPGLAKQPRYAIEEMARVKFGSGLEGADMVQNYIFVYRVASAGVGEVDTGTAVVESHFVRRYGSN